jgi:membrane protease YdiL (CAAX protease family)
VLITPRFTDPHSHCHVAEGIKDKWIVSCQSLVLASLEIVLLLFRRVWSWLFPPQRNYLVPWTGLEVAAVALLTHFVWAAFVSAVLFQSGFFVWQYGSEFPKLLNPRDETGGDQRGEAGYDDSEEASRRAVARARWNVWVTLFCFPLNVATILLLPRVLSDTRPYQLGLSTHRLGRNALLGVLGWFLLSLPVLAVNLLALWLYQHSTGARSTTHLLTVLSQSRPEWWEFALLVLSAVAAAPVLEELLYRGLLQRWFSQRSWGGSLAWCLAMAVALAKKHELIATASNHRDWNELGVAMQPAAFVLLLSPGLWLAARHRRPQVSRAILGTSALWAVLHSDSWPDPVALFVLGLGIGWLADRTRSLTGPIVLHSLFNSVACVMMFWP